MFRDRDNCSENDSFGTAPNCRPGQESVLAELSTRLVPPEYYDYLSRFSEEEAKALPPRRYVDHAIPLIKGGKPPFGRMYSMSNNDLKELKAWIEENLAKSFIQASSSSATSPIIIVQRLGSAP